MAVLNDMQLSFKETGKLKINLFSKLNKNYYNRAYSKELINRKLLGFALMESGDKRRPRGGAGVVSETGESKYKIMKHKKSKRIVPKEVREKKEEPKPKFPYKTFERTIIQKSWLMSADDDYANETEIDVETSGIPPNTIVYVAEPSQDLSPGEMIDFMFNPEQYGRKTALDPKFIESGSELYHFFLNFMIFLAKQELDMLTMSGVARRYEAKREFGSMHRPGIHDKYMQFLNALPYENEEMGRKIEEFFAAKTIKDVFSFYIYSFKNPNCVGLETKYGKCDWSTWEDTAKKYEGARPTNSSVVDSLAENMWIFEKIKKSRNKKNISNNTQSE